MLGFIIFFAIYAVGVYLSGMKLELGDILDKHGISNDDGHRNTYMI